MNIGEEAWIILKHSAQLAHLLSTLQPTRKAPPSFPAHLAYRRYCVFLFLSVLFFKINSYTRRMRRRRRRDSNKVTCSSSTSTWIVRITRWLSIALFLQRWPLSHQSTHLLSHPSINTFRTQHRHHHPETVLLHAALLARYHWRQNKNRSWGGQLQGGC